MKQYRVDDHKLVKVYLFRQAITTVITSFDRKDAYVFMEEECLKHICIDSQTVTKLYGKVFANEGYSITVTRNNKFVITGDWVGHGRKISVPNGILSKEIINGTIVKDIPNGTVIEDFVRRFRSVLVQI